MEIGSLAWRETYQQGFLPACGKREREQETSSSGRSASIWYSTLLPLWGMAKTRMRCTEEEAGPNLGTAARRWNQVRSAE